MLKKIRVEWKVIILEAINILFSYNFGLEFIFFYII